MTKLDTWQLVPIAAGRTAYAAGEHAFATTTLLSENFHGTGLQNARSTGRSEYRALEHVQQGGSGSGAHRTEEQDLALRTACPT